MSELGEQVIPSDNQDQGSSTADTSDLLDKEKSNPLIQQRINEVTLIYDRLSNNPDTETIAAQYSEICGQIDVIIENIAYSLAFLKGAELIPGVAQENMISQAENYLFAANEISERGSATVSVFGKIQTFYKIEDLVEHMGRIQEDFSKIGAFETSDFDQFQTEILPIVDKYLFSREIDVSTVPASITYLFNNDTDMDSRKIILEEKGYFNTEVDDVKDGDLEDGLSSVTSQDQHASIVIVDIPSEYALELDAPLYSRLLKEYKDKEEEERPIVILRHNGMTPMDLYDMQAYQPFLFSQTDDELKRAILLAKRLYSIRNSKTQLTNVLVSTKEQEYDDSTDLREWEHITADTHQSLKSFIMRANERNSAWRQSITELGLEEPIAASFLYGGNFMIDPGAISTPVHTVLDLGTGEGRIGGMLARAGFHVLGVELSQELINRGKERFLDEGKGLRSEADIENLSYPAMLQLQEEGVLQDGIVVDDEEATKNYLTMKGNFGNLYQGLESVLENWDSNFPHVTIGNFFNAENSPYIQQYSDGTLYIPTYFDAVVCNWHTWGEMANPADQSDVLSQVFIILTPGGEITLELPDTQVDPYASAIRANSIKNPDDPVGTVRDGDYSPRYFPSREEIIAQLEAAGFEIIPEEDISTYLIVSDTEEEGQKQLQVKELVVRARKPRDIDWR